METTEQGISITPQAAYALCECVDDPENNYILPTGWEINPDWLPPKDTQQGIYAKSFRETSTGTIAIVIQGTQNLWDVLKDFRVAEQKSFDCISGARISLGSHNGLDCLLNLVSSNPNSSRLKDYLQTLPSDASIVVTGHSLGGNLTSVLAPWIATNIAAFNPPSTGMLEQLPSNIFAMTFAAPTAGNTDFADFLDKQPNYQAFFNSNDVVPYAWANQDQDPWCVKHIERIWAASGIATPEIVTDVIKGKLLEMKITGATYAQTAGTRFSYPIQKNDNWMKELSYQHNTAYSKHFSGSDSASSQDSMVS